MRKLVRLQFLGSSASESSSTFGCNIGAFGAHPGHDAHLLPTLSAIQILVTQDALDRVDVDRVTKCQSLLSSCHLLL